MEETAREVQEVGNWLMGQGLEYGSNVVEAVLILAIGYWIAGRVAAWMKRALGKVDQIDETLIPFFASLARYAILIIVLIAVLNQFGVQTASIIAVFGAAGLAIGLALQGTLQNIAAGIMLLILRPFKVGDFVEVGPVSGTVNEIGLFTTQFTTLDGIYVSCPNGALSNSKVVNYSRHDRRRLDLVMGISYDDDIGKAMEILQGLMDADDRVLKDPAAACMVTNLGASSVDITMRCWAMSGDFWALKCDLTRLAKEKIEEGGLSIPYPQQDVHMHNVAAE